MDCAPFARASRVRVVVRRHDAEGEPVPGIIVRLHTWSEPSPYFQVRPLVTDAEGTVLYEDVRAGRVLADVASTTEEIERRLVWMS